MHAVCNIEAACDAARKNGRVMSVPPFKSWLTELDDELKGVPPFTPGAEWQAISAMRASRPELPDEVIWSRIVYPGLARTKRVPYRKHGLTDKNDQILRHEYGDSRVSSRTAIKRILNLHSEWSRDAVVWRARALGLARHRKGTVVNVRKGHCPLNGERR